MVIARQLLIVKLFNVQKPKLTIIRHRNRVVIHLLSFLLFTGSMWTEENELSAFQSSEKLCIQLRKKAVG